MRKKRKSRRRKIDLVYFISDGEFIKIGTTESMSHRLRALQTGSARQLKILGTIPGDRHVERLIHLKLKRYKYRSEWYLDVPEVRDVLAEHKKVPFLDQALRKRCATCGMFLAKRSKLLKCKKCQG